MTTELATDGWRIPGFVLDDVLGYGSSSFVWRAWPAGTTGNVVEARAGTAVAIKCLPVADPDELREAYAEAALLTVLEHPNLVILREVVRVGPGVALVLDLAEGGSLAGLIGRRGRLSLGEAIGCLTPIAEVLAYAHAQQVIHGDVTPANVLFSADARPLLSDLGVSRLVGDGHRVRSTPGHVDPAVAAGRCPQPSSDVFMLASVSLQLLTGRPVWPGIGPDEQLAAAGGLDFGDVDARLRILPESVAAVLKRGLSVDGFRRGTAAEFALDLARCAQPVPIELAAGRPAQRGGAHRRPDGPEEVRAGWVEWAASRESELLAARRSALTRSVRAALAPSAEDGAGEGWLYRLRKTVSGLSSVVRRRPGGRPSIAWPLGLGSLGVAAIVSSLALCWPTSSAGSERHSNGLALFPPVATPGRVPPTTAPPGHRPAEAVRMTAPVARRLLVELDRQRELAYARRDPELLSTVYLPGDALRADQGQLARLVPVGCGLDGAVTDYGSVMVAEGPATNGSVTVVATARLRPSILRCAGHVRGLAAGGTATRIRFSLTVTSSGHYRLSALAAA
jgi:hypothetical protein